MKLRALTLYRASEPLDLSREDIRRALAMDGAYVQPLGDLSLVAFPVFRDTFPGIGSGYPTINAGWPEIGVAWERTSLMRDPVGWNHDDWITYRPAREYKPLTLAQAQAARTVAELRAGA